MSAESIRKTVFGGCPHDCPDTCSMLYEVEGEKLVNVRGNPDHPFTRGGLCVKLKDFHDHHAHPERLLYPLRRTGPKGSRQFEQITWEQALFGIQAKWNRIIREHGPQAIFPYNYLGNEGTLQGLTVGDAFFNRMGATVAEKTFCAMGSSIAWLLTVGPTGGMDPESFAQSQYILIWACNSVSTNLHHWHVIHEAQKRGAKVVVIDAHRSLTAKQADWHLCPKPGTDGALAMAMINLIIQEELYDADYVANYTVGFEELKARAEAYTPERAEAITGIPGDAIRTLAREYATTQPAAIRMGVALERHHGGGQAIRAVCSLPALTGAWRRPGGGVMQMPVWEFPIHWDRICRPEWIPDGTRALNLLKLGEILNGRLPLDPPVKSLMVYNANPVSQAPEAERIVEGLAREDLFTVVSDHFLTDTAAYADIVLPAAMAAEMDDIMFSWGHFYLTLNQKAVEPPGEAVANTELFRRLAAAMGYDDEQFRRSDREMIEHYVDWQAPSLKGIDLAYLETHGYVHIRGGKPESCAPHAEGNFPTPSGKCEFKTSGAANGNFVAAVFRQMYEGDQGGEPLDDLPDYLPPRERPEQNAELAGRYPLNIVTPKSHAFLNSCYANEAHKVAVQGEQFVLINPADAATRGIQAGDAVRVFNDRGEFQGDARVTDDTPPGVVVATLGYWRSRNRGGSSVNAISSAAYSDLGHAPTYSDNLVEVARLA